MFLILPVYLRSWLYGYSITCHLLFNCFWDYSKIVRWYYMCHLYSKWLYLHHSGMRNIDIVLTSKWITLIYRNYDYKHFWRKHFLFWKLNPLQKNLWWQQYILDFHVKYKSNIKKLLRKFAWFSITYSLLS